MLKIKINGRSFNMPTHWEDITLTQCAWLYKHLYEQSDELVDYYRSLVNEDKKPLNPRDIEGFEDFYTSAICYLSSTPQELLQSTNVEDVEKLAMGILPRFILGIMGHIEADVAKGARSFKLGWKTYYMPSSGVDISGDPTPLSSLSAVEGCNLSDIILANNIGLASVAIAISCRPKGERYNEGKVQQRIELFKSLPASVYWELWVLTSAAHNYLRASYKDCYGQGGGSGFRSSAGPTWTNTLTSMAINNPRNLEYLQQMPYYDFMHLLSERHKDKKEEWKKSAALAGLKLK